MFLCLTAGINSYGQKICGTVVDKATKQPLSGANINIGKTTTSTDRSGAFEINRNQHNDSLSISYFGYQKYSVPLNNGKAALYIELEAKVISLKEVDIHFNRNNDLQKDFIINRMAYSKQFNYTGPKVMDAFTGNSVKQPGELLSINLLVLVEALTKKNTAEYKLNKVLIRDEQAEYVDRKFNKGSVNRIASLKGDSLLVSFWLVTGQTYQFVKQATDYDMEVYIKKSVLQFRAEQVAGKNPFAKQL